jgi:hypothetical protein
VQNHPVWSLVDDLRERLKTLDFPADPANADALSRVNWILEILDAHRAEDARRYTATMLENVNRQIAGAFQQSLNLYISDSESQAPALQQAAEYVDGIIDQMGSWPPISPKGSAQAAGKAYAAYEIAVKNSIESLREESDSLTESVESVKTDVKSVVAGLQNDWTAFQEEKSAGIDKTLADSLERSRRATLRELRKLRDLNEAAQLHSDNINKMDEEGSNIVASLARRAVAENFQKNARNKSAAGWVWDMAGVLVAGVPLSMVLWHFFRSENGIQSSTALVLTRLGITIAALGLATLCFRRGAENHRESRLAKRTDLRLRTVHAFIANQPEDVQEAVLEGMADRIYLQGILDDGGTHDSEANLAYYLSKARQRRVPPAREEGPEPS